MMRSQVVHTRAHDPCLRNTANTGTSTGTVERFRRQTKAGLVCGICTNQKRTNADIQETDQDISKLISIAPAEYYDMNSGKCTQIYPTPKWFSHHGSHMEGH